MVEAGAVPALAALLERAQPDGQYAAAAALYNLSGQDAEVRLALVTLGTVPPLVQMLRAESWHVSSFFCTAHVLLSYMRRSECVCVSLCLCVWVYVCVRACGGGWVCVCVCVLCLVHVCRVRHHQPYRCGKQAYGCWPVFHEACLREHSHSVQHILTTVHKRLVVGGSGTAA